MNAPYRVLLIGFDVMAQLPELHPTKFQYIQPAIAPINNPIRLRCCFLIKESIII